MYLKSRLKERKRVGGGGGIEIEIEKTGRTDETTYIEKFHFLNVQKIQSNGEKKKQGWGKERDLKQEQEIQ